MLPKLIFVSLEVNCGHPFIIIPGLGVCGWPRAPSRFHWIEAICRRTLASMAGVFQCKKPGFAHCCKPLYCGALFLLFFFLFCFLLLLTSVFLFCCFSYNFFRFVFLTKIWHQISNGNRNGWSSNSVCNHTSDWQSWTSAKWESDLLITRMIADGIKLNRVLLTINQDLI